ncbi:MAG: UbiA prenyltransferase family protein [Myxococcota bacterium]
MGVRHYVQIARPDHWFKNVFALPGVLLALMADPSTWSVQTAIHVAIAVVGLCLTASSNYVINELLDAPTDREHPEKKHRPAAAGLVKPAPAIVLWLVLGAAGVGVGLWVNVATATLLGVLWVMGVVYNVKPVRSKDLPYVDVLSESVNNPLRLGIGWFATSTLLVPPLSLLLAYWMLGAFFMAVKRFAEYRSINDPAAAAAYRRSFGFYNDVRLLVSVMAYASAASLFGGMFIVRYRLELVLAVPLIAVLFAWYLYVGHKPDSPAMKPEKLYRDVGITSWSALVFVVCCALLVVDIPILQLWFSPSIPSP